MSNFEKAKNKHIELQNNAKVPYHDTIDFKLNSIYAQLSESKREWKNDRMTNPEAIEVLFESVQQIIIELNSKRL